MTDDDDGYLRRLAKRKLVAQQTPELVPHGLNGYTNYYCRCEVCKAAGTAEHRRQRGRPVTKHGSLLSYSRGCRCRPCVEKKVAHNLATKRRTHAPSRWSKSDNDATISRATNHFKQWTGPELEVVARSDLSIKRMAEMLGRSRCAIEAKRRRIASGDPRTLYLLLGQVTA